MPSRYDYSTGSSVISCRQCGVRHMIPGRARNFDPSTDTTGATSVFYWYPNRRIFQSSCRTCFRATLDRARPATTRRGAAGTVGRLLGRRFGIEIECIVPGQDRDTIQAALNEAGLPAWKCKSDGSLSASGWEIVSPPISGETGMDELRTALRVLARLGASVDRTCGLHVHHEVADLTVDGIKRFVKNWASHQGLIDGLVSESRRGSNNNYCLDLQNYDLQAIERCTTLQELRGIGIDRYRKINLLAYVRYGTIEIRQHQGTLSYEKIHSWVMLGQAMLDTAKTTEMERASRVTEMISSLGEMMDEDARTYTIGRAVEFRYAAV